MFLLIRQYHTEKAFARSEKKQHTFLVARKANKVEIQKEFAQRYQVEPVAVNTMNYKGKQQKRYTKKHLVKGRTNSYKLAIITVDKEVVLDLQQGATATP